MRVGEVIDAYVALKTSLGMSFESARRVLEQFSREIGNPPIGEVQPEAVVAFLRGRGALSATWALKYKILSGFYRFAISRGHAQSSPLPANVPKLPPQRSPYVYSVDELRRLLEATSVVHINNTPLQAPMCRMLLILLYGSGLRVGEALHLTLRDIDLIEKIVTVRHTKFFKTRLVPIGPKLGAGTGCLHPAPARPSLAVGRRFSSLYNEDGPRLALPACEHIVPPRPTSSRYRLRRRMSSATHP